MAETLSDRNPPGFQAGPGEGSSLPWRPHPTSTDALPTQDPPTLTEIRVRRCLPTITGEKAYALTVANFHQVPVAQSIACPPLKRSVVGSILLSGPSCSLGYFPFQPVVHNWFIKGRSMYCSVYGKVHIKDPLLLIEKSSPAGFLLKSMST